MRVCVKGCMVRGRNVVIEFASSSIKWRKLLASGIELGSPHVHFSYVYRTVALYFIVLSFISIPFDMFWGPQKK